MTLLIRIVLDWLRDFSHLIDPEVYLTARALEAKGRTIEDVEEELGRGCPGSRDNLWETPEGDKRSVVEVEADEVAPSLCWAIAKPERATNGKGTSILSRPCTCWAALGSPAARPAAGS
jgi:hypothetical protein